MEALEGFWVEIYPDFDERSQALREQVRIEISLE
jgi:hypothetical protein